MKTMITLQQLELMVDDLADILNDVEDRVYKLEIQAGHLNESMSRAKRLLDRFDKEVDKNERT